MSDHSDEDDVRTSDQMRAWREEARELAYVKYGQGLGPEEEARLQRLRDLLDDAENQPLDEAVQEMVRRTETARLFWGGKLTTGSTRCH